MKFRMVPASICLPLQVADAIDAPVVEIALKPTSRYIVHVDIGTLKELDAINVMHQAKKAVDGFFPKGTVLYVPVRDGIPALTVFELEQVDETTTAQAPHQAP